MVRSKWWTTLTAACAVALVGCGVDQAPESAGSGEDYPTGPVTLVVPFSAGGPTDTTARAMADCLDKELGQRFVVENRPGAAGTIGTAELAEANPDGETLGMVSTTTAVAGPILQDDVSYTREDLQPLALLADVPSVIAVHPDSKLGSIQELFAAAKASPGSVTVAVPGSTTLFGIEIDRLAKQHGIELKAVPFDGGGEARAAVLGKNVDALWDAASQDLVDAIDQGQFKALATGAPEPQEFIDAPTLAEVGYPELIHSNTPFTLAAPAGVSKNVVSTLEETTRTCQGRERYVDTVGDEFVPEQFVGTERMSKRFGELADLYGSL